MGNAVDFVRRIDIAILLPFALVIFCSYLNADGWPYMFRSPLDTTLRQPMGIAVLACASWLLWCSPAATFRRSSLILGVVLFSWLQAEDATALVMMFWGYGYFLLAHVLASYAIGLRGWNSQLELVTQSESAQRFSIVSILVITAILAVFSLIAQATYVGDSVAEFTIATTGFAVSAACVQHGLTTQHNNRAWVMRGGMITLISVILIGWLRSYGGRYIWPGAFGKGGLLFSRYWIDVVASYSMFMLIVSLFAACAAWTSIRQACRRALWEVKNERLRSE